jgi:hypothetical protein
MINKTRVRSGRFARIIAPWIVLGLGGCCFPFVLRAPTPASIETGSKIVALSGRMVFSSKEALDAYRAGTRKQSEMMKDGSAFRLPQCISATVLSIQGDDVQIQQRWKDVLGEKFWIEKDSIYQRRG